MTEATQRFFCRSGFLLLCVLPTLVIGAWIGWRQTPAFANQQRADWQQELARTLGLRVEIGAISEPSPGKYVLKRVTLRDPDAPREQLPLARVERVDVLRSPAALVILASATEVASADLARFWTILHERLVRGPELAESTVHVGLSSIALVAPSGEPQSPLALTDVRIVLQNSAVGTQATLQFVPPGSTSQQPVLLGITRNRTHYPVATDWILNAQSAPIPSTLLATCLPAIAELGPAATFQGWMGVKTRDRSWDAQVNGEFRQVKLSSLTTANQTGYDDVLLKDAIWQGGRIVSAQDSIVLGRANYTAVALAQAVVTGDDNQVRHLLDILR